MNETVPYKSLFKLHFTVLIWGFTAILGAMVSLSVDFLVWHRMGIAALCLVLYLNIKGRSLHVPLLQALRLISLGCLLAFHWILFFYSIKVSTIAIALISLSTTTLFVSFFEPFINKQSVLLADILVGALIVIGIAMIFHFESQYLQGIVSGIAAAMANALLEVFNARWAKKQDAVIIAFYEMSGGFFAISIYLLLSGYFWSPLFAWPLFTDLLWIILLSTICTAFAFVLGVQVMQKLSAYTVALVSNMEPLYGMALALLFFGSTQAMSPGFYAGSSIVLLAVFVYPLLQRKLLALKQRKWAARVKV